MKAPVVRQEHILCVRCRVAELELQRDGELLGPLAVGEIGDEDDVVGRARVSGEGILSLPAKEDGETSRVGRHALSVDPGFRESSVRGVVDSLEGICWWHCFNAGLVVCLKRAWAHTHTHTHAHTRMHAHAHTYTYTQIHTHAHTHTRTHAYTHA